MPEIKQISFRPMNEDDLGLMLKWLTDERVLEFYDGRDQKYTQEAIRERYTKQKADGRYRVIIEYDAEPIGYAQYIKFRESFFRNTIILRRMKRFLQWTNLSVSRNIGTWESVQNIAKWYANICERKWAPTK